MICSKCGQDCADDVKFCTNCGTELVAEAQAEPAVEAVADTEGNVAEAVREAAPAVEEAKETVEENTAGEVKKEKKEKTEDGKKNTKLAVGGLSLVAILLLIFIPVIAMNSKDDSFMQISEKSVFQITERDGDLYAYYLDGDEVKLNDEKASSQVYSMDGSVVCYKNENEELVILKEGELIETGIDEVRGVQVSSAGDTLVYFSDCEYATYYETKYGYEDTIRVGTLNLYDIKKKSNIEIAEEVVVDSAVLSPDGRTVAYVAEYDATDDFKAFYSVNGKEPVEVGKEKRIFGIANKAKYIYYTDEDRVYVMKKDEEEKLATDIRYVEVMFNADLTEMLFFNDDKTYITVKGGEKKKVANTELDYVILDDTAAEYEMELDTEVGDVTVTYTGVDSFEDKLFYSDTEYEIFYMKNKYETEKLASSVFEYAVADDGESLLYVDGINIVEVTKFSKGGEKKRLGEDIYVSELYADGDLKHIYYVNWEGELCYLKGDKEKKIADDVTDVMISPDGSYCYYVVENEDLCYSKNGGKEKELLVADDGKISCLREGGMLFVTASEDAVKTLYRMNGKKLKTVYEVEVKNVNNYEDAMKEYEDALKEYEDYLDYYLD